MGDETKIPFSLAEMQLIESAEIFLTKKQAFDHTKEYLSLLLSNIEKTISITEGLKFIAEEFTYRKISHGESYNLMPYQVSDYPAKFNNENIFTIRCIVWWGYEVSIHLLLQGSYYKEYFHSLQSNLYHLPNSFYGCIADTPWEHHFEEHNYLPLKNFKLNPEQNFCKIGKKYALSILTKGTEEIENDIISLLKLLISS